MAYYNGGWRTQPKATIKQTEMAKRDDVDILEAKVDKLVQFIKDNRHYSEAMLERLKEVETMLGASDYDRHPAYLSWLENRIEELGNEIARIRGNTNAQIASKKRAKVTICAGKDKVIVRI